MEQKRIDNLPPELISQILCCLPFKEAGKACVLSSKWKSCSRRMPKLVFDPDTFEMEGGHMHDMCRFNNAISHVLLHHEGSITEFSLKVNDHPNTDIDSYISYLSKNNIGKNIEKFNLETLGEYYRIPSSLYKLEGLTELCLAGSDIRYVPANYKGFERLSILTLTMVDTELSTLIFLLKGCSMLKSLTLDTDYIEVGESSTTTVTSFFECFVNIEFLSIFYILLEKIIRSGSVPKVLPIALPHLKVLHMEQSRFSSKHMFSMLLLLMRSSPNLEKLKLKNNYEENNEEGEYVWMCRAADHPDLILHHLRLFELHNLSDTFRELDVVRLVLAKSPGLKWVNLFLSQLVEEEEDYIVEAMTNTNAASPSVKFSIKPFEGPKFEF